MDIKNPVHTVGTYRLERAEQTALMLVLGALVLWHWREVDWWKAVAAFWTIDILGYLPGAIVYRRQRGGAIAPIYHHLYNIAHTYLAVGAVVAVWWLMSGPEWAMLAGPFHLALDRGVFGNIFKPVALPFEPVAAPEVWQHLITQPEQTGARGSSVGHGLQS
jgi:hypothetical protein